MKCSVCRKVPLKHRIRWFVIYLFSSMSLNENERAFVSFDDVSKTESEIKAISIVTSTVPEMSYSWFFSIKLPKLLKEAQKLVHKISTRVAKVGTILPPQMAQMTSQPKSKQREILNWPIREQGMNNNIGCQPISFGTSHQPISFGTFFGTYISLTNQNVQPKRNGKMSKQFISGTVEVTRSD